MQGVLCMLIGTCMKDGAVYALGSGNIWVPFLTLSPKVTIYKMTTCHVYNGL